MDTTALQAKIDALKAQEVTDETAVENDKTALALAEAELAQATLINQLESMPTDEATIAAINAALLADGSSLVLSVTPSAAATT